MVKPDIWYVSFGADKALKGVDGAPARTTRTFKSEADARLFAAEILRKGWTASAGTINPHQPKQMIAPADIEGWANGLGAVR
jgi:hypothetical protein